MSSQCLRCKPIARTLMATVSSVSGGRNSNSAGLVAFEEYSMIVHVGGTPLEVKISSREALAISEAMARGVKFRARVDIEVGEP